MKKGSRVNSRWHKRDIFIISLSVFTRNINPPLKLKKNPGAKNNCKKILYKIGK
jgi:hypothetical protein